MTHAIVNVGDVCDQIRGVTYSKDEASNQPQAGYLPLLRANNITEAGLTFDDLVYVPVSRIKNIQRIRTHDVVIAASSGSLDVVGKAARANSDFEGAFGAFCKVLRPYDCIDPGYFAHFFQTQKYRRTVSALAAGANINNLRGEHLNNLQLPLPSIAEQIRIATILDKADALRFKRREAIAKLDQLLQSVFVDMFGDPVTNPKMWPLHPVGDVFSGFVGGQNVACPESGSSSYRILKVSAVTKKVFLAEQSKIAPDELIPDPDHIVQPGDLLFSRANTADLVAATAYVWETPPNIVLPDKIWKMIIRDQTKLDPLFAWELFKNHSFRHELSKRSSGTSGSMKNISKAKLVEVPMPLPPFNLQVKFSQFSRELHSQRRLIKIQSQGLEKFKSSLNLLTFGQ